MNRKVSVRIHYDRPLHVAVLLAVALAAGCLAAYLAWGYKEASAVGQS